MDAALSTCCEAGGGDAGGGGREASCGLRGGGGAAGVFGALRGNLHLSPFLSLLSVIPLL